MKFMGKLILVCTTLTFSSLAMAANEGDISIEIMENEPSYSVAQIVAAVAEGDFDLLRSIHQSGYDLKPVVDARLGSLVHVAAKRGDFELVRFLVVECGLDINNQMYTARQTPLLVAVQNHHFDTAQAMVAIGALTKSTGLNSPRIRAIITDEVFDVDRGEGIRPRSFSWPNLHK